MLGLESDVTIGLQATTADPVTLNRQRLQVYSFTGGQTEENQADNILGGGLKNTSDPSSLAPGLDEHRVTVVVPLCINQFPFWMAAFFGTLATTGTNPNFIHKGESGQALPGIFIEHKLKTGILRRHSYCVGERMELDLSADAAGYGRATLTFVGLKETKAASELTGTIAPAPALLRPAQKTVAIAYNSVVGGDLTGGRLTFARQLQRRRSADGTGIPYTVEQEGASELSGSLSMRYNGDTIYDDGVAKTEREILFSLMQNANRGLKWRLPTAMVQRTPIGVEGPDGINLDVPFLARQTTTLAALECSALSGSATLVLPATP